MVFGLRAPAVIGLLLAGVLAGLPYASLSAPWLTLPSSSAQGETIDLTGGGFPADADLLFILESPAGKAQRSRIESDTDGRISVQIELAEPGSYLAEVWPADGSGAAPLEFLLINSGGSSP